MVDNMEITRINNLTFRELRNELANCQNNPVRETIIRNLMYIRYNQHLQKKQQLEKIKKEQRRKQISKIKNKLEEKYKTNDMLRVDDFIDQSDEEINFNESDFKTLKPVHGSLNELDDDNGNDNDNNELFDSRAITEYERDYANNNLMERLNIDMDLRKIKVESKKKEFVTPYADTVGGNYAPFHRDTKSEKNNFSNLKFGKKK